MAPAAERALDPAVARPYGAGVLGHHWVKATGTVIAVATRETALVDGAAGVEYDGFVVDVHPEGDKTFRAEVREAGHAIGNFVIDSLNFEPPRRGDTVSVEFDPKTHKTRFDMSDPRLQKKASRKARDDEARKQYNATLGEPPAT